jgi:hypothetical protein
MHQRIAFPVTSREQAERHIAEVQAMARHAGCPIHLVWIVDVSPFVHWSAHGPVVDRSDYGDAVPRRRLNATSYLSRLARDVSAFGIPVSCEVRTGLPAFELSALRRQGDVLVVETEQGCEQSPEALDRLLTRGGDVGAIGDPPAGDRLRAGESTHVLVFAGPHMTDDLCCGM